MIHLPDWVGYILLAVAFPGAAIAIAWAHARDIIRSAQRLGRRK